MDISASVRIKQPLPGTFVEIAAAGAARGDLQEAVDDALRSPGLWCTGSSSFHDPQSDVSRLNRAVSRCCCLLVHAWTYQVLEAVILRNE